ncbi:MAG: PKD domain-containing protein [Candidatus Levyibacteriota bacterium]|nr:MAG: PKD domain-containing protein [Candidatus Levybacteria bacterium]
MTFLSTKKLLIFGFLATLLTVIPITVFFLQNQTRTKSGAEQATILCFTLPQTNGTCLNTTTPVQKNIDENISLDIYLDPTGGTGVEKNKIVVATININYDNSKLEADPSKGTGLGFTFPVSIPASQGFGSNALVPPAYTSGNASVTLSVGTDALKAISQKTKIATITFKTLAAAPEGVSISFDQTKSNATSTIDPEVNVLSSVLPALVKIAAAAGTTPINTPIPGQPSATPIPATQPGASTPNQLPICTGLNIDRATSGNAPFSITFTANGNDPDGTISSVTFDFGDGPVETVTTGGGIGSKTISVAKAHTYNNSTTFTAKATLTDNKGGLSAESSTCKQTITVNPAPTGTGGGTVISTLSPTPIVIAQDTPTPLPKKEFKEQPGPGDTFLGIGGVGAALIIVGTILFFAL